mmetsp:Transcript_31379/g.77621  ORF Transcript_31379/g.77621 Transcript_31379/m.77621 type:complete len:490 (-) Transcript_31379:480-1949(-)
MPMARYCVALALALACACVTDAAVVGARPAHVRAIAMLRGGDRAGVSARKPSLRGRAQLSAVAGSQNTEQPGSGGGTMSVSASSVALMKNIVGGGLLALPAGMAAAQGTGFVPAIGVCTVSAILSGYTYWTIGEAVQATGATDFKSLWDKTLGKKSSWVINSTIICLAFSAVVMYGCFLGDLISALVPSLTRTSALVGVTAAVLLPLCLQRDLSALSFTSYTGIGAVAFTAFVIVKRWLDGTYGAAGNFLLAGLPYAPALGQLSAMRLSAGTFVLFNMLSTAYMAHTNAVRFYTELKDRSPRKFATVCAVGFGSAAVAHALVMVAGYATFGGASQGLILNNLHLSADKLASAARVATGISIMGSHPLLFTSLRDSVLSSLSGTKIGDAVNESPAAWTALSVGMLVLATLTAIVATDVGFVASVSGASLGAILIFVVPGLMQLSTIQMAGGGAAKGGKATIAKGLVAFGGVMAVLGTTVTCLETFTDVFR